MKRKHDLLKEKSKTRDAVGQISSWCLLIALHQRFGVGADRMDDMGAIIEGKAAAWELVEEVDNYLQTNLGLNLNQKTAVIPIGNPVEFVGRKISPVKIELRRQTTLGMKKHLRYVQDAYAAGEIDLDYALSVITSYRGLFKDVTSDAFLEKMLDEFVLSRPALEA